MAELAVPLTVTFDGSIEIYTFGKPVPVGSSLVKNWKEIVEKSMDMSTMHQNMVRAARLLRVGHLASADFKAIQAQIWQVLSDYQAAVNDTDLAMTSFGLGCGDVLERLLEALCALSRGEVKDAIKSLNRCAKYADGLATQATEIAETFMCLKTAAGAAVKDALNTAGLEQAKAAAIDAQINTIKADYARLQSLTASYEDKKKVVQELYEAAVKRAETAETRAFISSLVGGICSAVGQGLGAYASARTPSINISGQGAVAPTQGAVTPAKVAAEKPSAAGNAETPASKVGKIKAGDSEGLKKELEADTNPGKTLGKGTGTDKTATPDPAAGGGTGDEHSAPTKAASEAEVNARLKGIGAAVDAVSERADKAADGAQEMATAIRSEVQQLLALRFEIEDKKAEGLAKLKQYTVQLQDNVNTVSHIEIAVASLAQAIGAMQSVVSIFLQFSRFWRTMALVCGRLGAKADFMDRVEAIESESQEVVHNIVTGNDFMRAGIEYCAGWTALQDLTTTYRTQMISLADDVALYVSENPSETNAREQTLKLAKELGLEVDKAQETAVDNAKRIAAINKVIKDTTPAANEPLVIS